MREKNTRLSVGLRFHPHETIHVGELVQNKRGDKRASKQKATQRNRRYEKRMLRHLGRVNGEDS